jgi:hypothetical protein
MFTSSKPNPYGISGNHAYELRRLHKIDHQGKKLTLMKLRNPWGYEKYHGSWKPGSNNWNDDIKRKVNHSDLEVDKGLFYIPWNEYTGAYHNVSICMEANTNKYNHSGQTMIDFNRNQQTNTFLKFRLDKDYNCATEAFTINLYQQGPRIEGHQLDKFTNSAFSIMLMTEDGQHV